MERWWTGYSPAQAAAELPGLYEERRFLAIDMAECLEYRQHRATQDVARAQEELAEVIGELEALAAQEVEVAA